MKKAIFASLIAVLATTASAEQRLSKRQSQALYCNVIMHRTAETLYKYGEMTYAEKEYFQSIAAEIGVRATYGLSSTQQASVIRQMFAQTGSEYGSMQQFGKYAKWCSKTFL